MNGDTLLVYAEQGLTAATLSFELTLPQTAFAEQAGIPTGLFVYGRQPLMLMRNCPHRCAAGCDGCDKNGGTGLYDRKGTFFPVMWEGGCAERLNSVVLDLAAEAERLPKQAFWLFHFTDESADEVEKVLRRYEKNEAATGATTRGLYRRGVL
jgi:putative protease